MPAALTIVGSSARAAAQSAARSGFVVHAADLFADADLRAIASVHRIGDYPQGLERLLYGPQPGAWMYTGALENHPDLIQRWECQRPLLGNPATVLRRVRDPLLLQRALQDAGLRTPAATLGAAGLPRDGSWLAKPLHSAGGVKIRPVTEQWDSHSPDLSGYYFQQRLEGRPVAAIFLATARDVRLIGVTEQLCGPEWGGTEFRYCGSLGPLSLPDSLTDEFQRIGRTLHQAFSLVGLFGVDAILNDAGAWPVEVNPRYTASVETLERACGFNAIASHALACERNTIRDLPGPVRMCGKLLTFAEGACRLTLAASQDVLLATMEAMPALADIPSSREVIAAGWPIATVLAEADNALAVAELLRRRSEALRACCQPA